MNSWSEYFELSKNLPPNDLLISATKLVVDRDQALDLGAGSLKDCKFLLSMGFKKVCAVDHDPAVKNYRDKTPAKSLKIEISPFESLRIKSKTYDLISAQYSLSFTNPPHLPALMEKITAGLKPNGIFCAQFFGIKDSWNIPENQMSFVSRQQLTKMLQPLNLIFLKEHQKNGRTLDGERKHWHFFEIIALKPGK